MKNILSYYMLNFDKKEKKSQLNTHLIRFAPSMRLCACMPVDLKSQIWCSSLFQFLNTKILSYHMLKFGKKKKKLQLIMYLIWFAPSLRLCACMPVDPKSQIWCSSQILTKNKNVTGDNISTASKHRPRWNINCAGERHSLRDLKYRPHNTLPTAKHRLHRNIDHAAASIKNTQSEG